MRAVFCDMCGAQIKAVLARFDMGVPEIRNAYGEVVHGGGFDLCTKCAGEIEDIIRKTAAENAAEKEQKEQER